MMKMGTKLIRLERLHSSSEKGRKKKKEEKFDVGKLMLLIRAKLKFSSSFINVSYGKTNSVLGQTNQEKARQRTNQTNPTKPMANN